MTLNSFVVVVVGALFFIVGALWYWFSGPYWERKATLLSDGTTITVRNGQVDIKRRKDDDCELVDPNLDYRECSYELVCSANTTQTRAVNVKAFDELGTQQPDCPLGGIISYDAKCVRGRCLAVRVR